MGRKTWAALALGVAASAMTAAPAGAATVTVTGDSGTPIAIAPGAPPSIRNMDVDVAVTLTGAEQAYSVSFVGPVGNAATPFNCYSFSAPRGVDYQGNGPYTLTVTTYTNIDCTAGATAATYQYNVGAGTAITPPSGNVLTRKPNSYSTRTYQVPVAINPGALSTRLDYALGASVGPDGAIAGPSTEVFVDRTTGLAQVSFKSPGTYTLVAHALGYSGAFTPWSAPVSVRAFAPFDFVATPSFPDDRGDSYKLRGIVREKAARGSKVRISLARGNKGGRFHSIGKAKIRRGGKITKRFTIRNPGKYRLKYRFKGNAKVLPGTYVQKFTITRRFI